MLSLGDFKSFAVNNQIRITGGERTLHTTGGQDFIYESNGEASMDINGVHAGCSCNSGNTTFSHGCCSEQ